MKKGSYKLLSRWKVVVCFVDSGLIYDTIVVYAKSEKGARGQVTRLMNNENRYISECKYLGTFK